MDGLFEIFLKERLTANLVLVTDRPAASAALHAIEKRQSGAIQKTSGDYTASAP